MQVRLGLVVLVALVITYYTYVLLNKLESSQIQILKNTLQFFHISVYLLPPAENYFKHICFSLGLQIMFCWTFHMLCRKQILTGGPPAGVSLLTFELVTKADTQNSVVQPTQARRISKGRALTNRQFKHSLQ